MGERLINDYYGKKKHTPKYLHLWHKLIYIDCVIQNRNLIRFVGNFYYLSRMKNK